MKKATIIKILSLVLVFALLVVCVSAVSCSLLDDAEDAFNDIVDDVEKEVEDLTSSLSFEMQNSPNISLCSMTETFALDTGANGLALPSMTVKATVFPENAPAEYKMLNWTVEWIENNTGNPGASATSYITVTPVTGDTHTVNIVCHKYFGGSEIGVRATTTHGDFTAVCKVTCQGFPSKLNIVDTDASQTVSDTAYTVLSGHTYQFEITPQNGIGHVGEMFHNIEIVSYTEQGSVVCEVASMGPTSQISYSLEDDSLPAFMEYSLEGNVLTVTVSNLVDHGSGDRYMKDFCFYYSGIEDCTFEFLIREKTSGLERILSLTIQTAGSVIEMDNDAVVF